MDVGRLGRSQEILAPLLETFNSLEGSAKDVWKLSCNVKGGLLFQCDQLQSQPCGQSIQWYRSTKAAQLELLRAHPFVERKLREVPFFLPFFSMLWIRASFGRNKKHGTWAYWLVCSYFVGPVCTVHEFRQMVFGGLGWWLNQPETPQLSGVKKNPIIYNGFLKGKIEIFEINWDTFLTWNIWDFTFECLLVGTQQGASRSIGAGDLRWGEVGLAGGALKRPPKPPKTQGGGSSLEVPRVAI